MAQIRLAPEVLEDFDRFFDHPSLYGIENIPERVARIVSALEILTHSPMIGRKSGSGLRELIIGARSQGYVALYRYVPDLDTVFILAVRSQPEGSYKRGY